MDFFFFFFKQKTAYEMRISDWSSDVCSSDLGRASKLVMSICSTVVDSNSALRTSLAGASGCETVISHSPPSRKREGSQTLLVTASRRSMRPRRSEEHTSELQSLMRISYAVFCWKKKQTCNDFMIP